MANDNNNRTKKDNPSLLQPLVRVYYRGSHIPPFAIYSLFFVPRPQNASKPPIISEP